MFDECLAARGRGAICAGCPLAPDAACVRALERLQRQAADLRARNPRISEADREILVEETLEDLIMRAEQGKVEYAPGLVASIFNHKTSNLYSGMGRFGDRAAVDLSEIPDGLAELADRHSGALRLEGSRLSAAAEPDPALRAELLSLSDAQKWRKTVDRLFAHARKPKMVETETAEGASLWETLPAPNRANPEEQMLDRQKWTDALNQYLRVWAAIGTRQAKNCAEEFAALGERIVDADAGDRASLAAELGEAENTLNQRVKRCYDLVHQYLAGRLADLTEDGDERIQECRRLLMRIYGPGVRGWRERLERQAAERGVRTGDITRQLRNCLERLLEEAA